MIALFLYIDHGYILSLNDFVLIIIFDSILTFGDFTSLLAINDQRSDLPITLGRLWYDFFFNYHYDHRVIPIQAYVRAPIIIHDG